jgi:hypothetical protein
MYRVNASLEDQPHDIGRARAFSPGWLENGSIWLHMSYKYLLELLRAGLYEQFFAELPKNLVPFMDPSVYGRSPLENSSFHRLQCPPGCILHGAGFVARLSGSTAEFLSMWQLMMTGPSRLSWKDGELQLALKPALPGAGSTRMETVLPSARQNGCDLPQPVPPRYVQRPRSEKTVLRLASGETVEFPGGIVPAPYAQSVRDGNVAALDVYFGS